MTYDPKLDSYVDNKWISTLSGKDYHIVTQDPDIEVLIILPETEYIIHKPEKIRKTPLLMSEYGHSDKKWWKLGIFGLSQELIYIEGESKNVVNWVDYHFYKPEDTMELYLVKIDRWVRENLNTKEALQCLIHKPKK